MTYQKVIVRLNSDLTLIFIITFSKSSEMIKVLINPAIGSLNDFLAIKFYKALVQGAT